MANLNESSQFDANVYQIETTDPVLGGPNGIANAQAKALANRTKYLNEKKAPLDSPEFTGTPKAPTPARFDKSTKVATMEAVQRALGNLPNALGITQNTTLGAEAAGNIYLFFGGSSGVTLPAANTLAPGSCVQFFSIIDGCAVYRQGADSIMLTDGAYVEYVSISAGDTLRLMSDGGKWCAIEGSTMLPRSAAMKGANFTTPPQFANDKKLATMEAVQRALGNFQGLGIISQDTTLLQAQVGNLFVPAAAGVNVTLPTVAGLPLGSRFVFLSYADNVTVKAAAGQALNGGAGGDVASIVMNAGDTLEVARSDNGTVWFVTGGTAGLKTSTAVRRLMGNYGGDTVFTASTQLAAGDAGRLLFGNSPTAMTLTLPAANSVATGAVFHFANFHSGALTVAPNGSDTISAPDAMGSPVLNAGDTLDVESDGFGYWRAVGGTTALVKSTAVRRLLGNYQTYGSVPVTMTLAATDCGKLIALTGPNTTVTLPPTSGLPAGSVVSMFATADNVTVACGGSGVFNFGTGTTGTFTLNKGDTLIAGCVDGANNWWVAGGSTVALPYAGAMKGPNFTTPGKFDASKRLATMEAVKAAGFQYASQSNITAAGNLSPDQAGQLLNLNGAPGAVFLPLASAVPAGTTYTLFSQNAGWVISTSGGQYMNAGSANIQTVTLGKGDTAVFHSDGISTWILAGGGVLAPYSATFKAASLGNYNYANVTANRAKNTTYTNSTGRPLFVAITVLANSGNGGMRLYQDGTEICCYYNGGANNATYGMLFGVIRPGGTYSINDANSVNSVAIWLEA